MLLRLVGFYGVSTFIGYLTQNPFSCKSSALFQAIQFCMGIQFNHQNSSNSANSVSMSTDFVYTQLNVKTVLY